MFVHDFVRLNVPYEEAVARFGANVDPWFGMLVASACRNDMAIFVHAAPSRKTLAKRVRPQRART